MDARWLRRRSGDENASDGLLLPGGIWLGLAIDFLSFVLADELVGGKLVDAATRAGLRVRARWGSGLGGESGLRAGGRLSEESDSVQIYQVLVGGSRGTMLKLLVIRLDEPRDRARGAA